MKALTTRLVTKKKVYVYNVDVEITLAVGKHRTLIIPYSIPARNDIEAAEIAVARELNERREIDRIGAPRVHAVYKLEFREGW